MFEDYNYAMVNPYVLVKDVRDAAILTKKGGNFPDLNEDNLHKLDIIQESDQSEDSALDEDSDKSQA